MVLPCLGHVDCGVNGLDGRGVGSLRPVPHREGCTQGPECQCDEGEIGAASPQEGEVVQREAECGDEEQEADVP